MFKLMVQENCQVEMEHPKIFQVQGVNRNLNNVTTSN